MVVEDSSSSEEEEDDGDFETVLGMIVNDDIQCLGEDHSLAAYTLTVIERMVMPRS